MAASHATRRNGASGGIYLASSRKAQPRKRLKSAINDENVCIEAAAGSGRHRLSYTAASVWQPENSAAYGSRTWRKA